MTEKQKEIFDRIGEIKDRMEDAKCEMGLLRKACEQLNQERREAIQRAERAEQHLAELKEFAYDRAPKIAAEEATKQTAPLKEEVKRLRDELGYIANAQRKSFKDAEEFRVWAQRRARHALGQEAGALTITKGQPK